MAYGCQASLDHAVAYLQRAADLLAEAQKVNRERGDVSPEQRMIVEAVGAIAYVADAVKYLKAGVP